MHTRISWLRQLTDSLSAKGSNPLIPLLKGRWGLSRSEGYALLTTLVVSSVLLTFGAVVMTIAMYEVKETDRWRRSNEAYFMARAAITEAVYRLKNEYEDITADEYVDAVSFGESKGFSFLMEPVDPDKVHFMGTRYMTGAFRVEAVGIRGYNRRGIETRIERDTFLRFSRFVQEGDLSYGANAEIIADLYVGGNLDLNGAPVTFWGDVAVGGTINNESNGIFHGDISGTGSGVDLSEAVDLDHYRDLSRGFIPGEGTGLYLSSAASIDLSLFDFTSPVPNYDGNPLPGDFNGVVFCEGDINVEGVLEGHSLTFISADDIIATDNIRTGNTLTGSRETDPPLVFDSSAGIEQVMVQSLSGIVTSDTNVLKFRISGQEWEKARMILLEDSSPIAQADLVRTSYSPEDGQMTVMNGLELDPSFHTYTAEIHYFSDGEGGNNVWIDACEGDPVNIGFAAKDKFYIDYNTPRQLTIDAAILTRDRSWTALGSSSDHPYGYDGSKWELTINGPIITYDGGSAGPYLNGKRYYQYDIDMIEYAPPAFPVPSEWWKVAYWRHLREREITL
jgi:hypothetical protein